MNPTEEFERNRAHLQSVAYRMLGSITEAEDAVQEAWLRLDRARTDEVDNMRAWLTMIVSRVCLDTLRSRRARHEELVEGSLPEPIVTLEAPNDPAHEVLIADSVGLALQIVLDTLSPAERLAFVLHDIFGMPFEEIAPIVERSVQTTRQLASRARRRVRGAKPSSQATDAQQRAVINAFLAASREGDFDALLAVLDPDVVRRADLGPGRVDILRGAEPVATQARMFARAMRLEQRPALVNGSPGAVAFRDGRPFSIAAFEIAGDRIVGIDILADRDRVAALDLTAIA
jgi:RNA polymerase sigma-70 factor (ECF subfamily)